MAASLAGCRPGSVEPLQHEAYVWKRQWRDSTEQAIRAAAADLAGVRVLVAQFDAQGRPVPARVRPWQGLPALPVVAVVRIEGTRLPAAPEAVRAVLAEGIDALALAPGQLRAVEVDHDAATGQLPAYADWLARFARLPPLAPALGITTLPDWLHSPQLPRLLRQVDSAVLQVHAVDAPEAGLLDAGQALARVQHFGRRSPVPFQVALPSYWLSAGMDDEGRVRFVEAEAPLARRAARQGDLATSPVVLAALLADLERRRPRQLTGVIWFRLPESGDRRILAWPTLRDLIRGRAIDANVQPALQATASAGNFDLVIANAGGHEALAPATIQWPAQCRHGEGVAGYRWRSGSTQTGQPPMLRPGEQRRLGWAWCPGAQAGPVAPAAAGPDRQTRSATTLTPVGPAAGDGIAGGQAAHLPSNRL